MLRVRVDPKAVVKLRIADRDVAGYAFGQTEAREDAKRRGEFELAMLPFIIEAGEYRWLGQTSADWFGNLQLADFRVAHDILLRADRSLDFRLHRGDSPSTICHKIASCAHNVWPHTFPMETNCDEALCADDNAQKKTDDLARDIIKQIADKWTILVIDAPGTDGEMRFSRLREHIGGIRCASTNLARTEGIGFAPGP